MQNGSSTSTRSYLEKLESRLDDEIAELTGDAEGDDRVVKRSKLKQMLQRVLEESMEEYKKDLRREERKRKLQEMEDLQDQLDERDLEERTMTLRNRLEYRTAIGGKGKGKGKGAGVLGGAQLNGYHGWKQREQRRLSSPLLLGPTPLTESSGKGERRRLSLPTSLLKATSKAVQDEGVDSSNATTTTLKTNPGSAQPRWEGTPEPWEQTPELQPVITDDIWWEETQELQNWVMGQPKNEVQINLRLGTSYCEDDCASAESGGEGTSHPLSRPDKSKSMSGPGLAPSLSSLQEDRTSIKNVDQLETMQLLTGKNPGMGNQVVESTTLKKRYCPLPSPLLHEGFEPLCSQVMGLEPPKPHPSPPCLPFDFAQPLEQETQEEENLTIVTLHCDESASESSATSTSQREEFLVQMITDGTAEMQVDTPEKSTVSPEGSPENAEEPVALEIPATVRNLLQAPSPQRFLRSPPKLPQGVVVKRREETIQLQGHSEVLHKRVEVGNTFVPRNAAPLPEDETKQLLEHVVMIHNAVLDLWKKQTSTDVQLKNTCKQVAQVLFVVQEAEKKFKAETKNLELRKIKDDNFFQDSQNQFYKLQEDLSLMQTQLHFWQNTHSSQTQTLQNILQEQARLNSELENDKGQWQSVHGAWNELRQRVEHLQNIWMEKGQLDQQGQQHQLHTQTKFLQLEKWAEDLEKRLDDFSKTMLKMGQPHKGGSSKELGEGSEPQKGGHMATASATTQGDDIFISKPLLPQSLPLPFKAEWEAHKEMFGLLQNAVLILENENRSLRLKMDDMQQSLERLEQPYPNPNQTHKQPKQGGATFAQVAPTWKIAEDPWENENTTWDIPHETSETRRTSSNSLEDMISDPILPNTEPTHMRQGDNNLVSNILVGGILSNMQPDCKIQQVDVAPITTSSASPFALMMGGKALSADWPRLEQKSSGGWENFERQWKAKIDLITGLCGTTPNGNILLEFLKNCLDEADNLFLLNQKEKKEKLSFEEFFQMLKEKYCVDPTMQNRRAWESLNLHQHDKIMKMEEWSIFKEKFLMLKNRVEDRTEIDEYTLLMQKLPTFWKREVVKEESKKRHWKMMVRIGNLPTTSIDRIKHAVETKTGEQIETISTSGQGVLVTVKGEKVAQKIIALNNCTWGGKALKVSKVDMIMTADEICDFITTRVMDEEKLQHFHNPLEKEKHRQIHEIKEQPPKKDDTRQNRGRSRSPNRQNKGKGDGGRSMSRGRNHGREQNSNRRNNSTPPRQNFNMTNSEPGDIFWRSMEDLIPKSLGGKNTAWGKDCGYCYNMMRCKWNHSPWTCAFHNEWKRRKQEWAAAQQIQKEKHGGTAPPLKL